MRSILVPLLAATAINAFPQKSLEDALIPLFIGPVKFGPAPTGCSKYEMIIARGTGEPGPFGAVVGDKLEKEVSRLLPGSRGYAVQYPANLDMSKSAPTGIDDVIKRLNKQNKECPDQTFVLVGYSQGAGVMHGALGPPQGPYPGGPEVRPKLDSSVLTKIKALVMFGDPGFKGGNLGPLTGNAGPFPSEFYGKLRENCALKDPVCDVTAGGFENHLQYVQDKYQKPSVDFIIAAFKGETLPKAPRNPQERDDMEKADA